MIYYVTVRKLTMDFFKAVLTDTYIYMLQKRIRNKPCRLTHDLNHENAPVKFSIITSALRVLSRFLSWFRTFPLFPVGLRRPRTRFFSRFPSSAAVSAAIPTHAASLLRIIC